MAYFVSNKIICSAQITETRNSATVVYLFQTSDLMQYLFVLFFFACSDYRKSRTFVMSVIYLLVSYILAFVFLLLTNIIVIFQAYSF